MNERTTLGFDIQVRLDKILGLEKFSEVKQAIQDQVQPIGGQVESLFDSQKSMETYKGSVKLSKELGYNSNQQIISALTEPQTQTAFNRANDQVANLWDTITKESEKRKSLGQEPITPSRFTRYENEFGKIFQSAQDVLNQRIQAIETKFGKDDPLVQAQTDIMTRAQEKLNNVYKDNIDALEEYYESLKKGETGLKGFIQSLSLLGTIGFIGSQVVKATGLYEEGQIMEKQIERQHALAFDMTSPINTYQMDEQADLFERQRERTFKAKVDSQIYGFGGGALAGGVALGVASAFGAPITAPVALGTLAIGTALGQNFLGTYLGGEAEQENIQDDQQVQEKLRAISQSNQIINSAVQKYRSYDIARTQEEFRFGKESGNRILSRLGYTTDQEVGLETAFGESLGRYDKDLFLEQTKIGRGLGIDPRALYGLNRTTQLTGVEFDSKFIAQADTLRQQLYGDDSDNKKLVDVLNASRDILEKILNVNVEGNKDQVFQFANLPRMIFGDNSAYGRIDLLGGRTLNTMEGLMKPSSLAHEAFLYQALKPKDIVDFQETLKGGLLGNDGETREKLFTGLREAGKVLDRTSLYSMLDQMMPNAPKGFLPQFTDLFQNGEVEVDGKKVTLDGILKGTDEKGKEFFENWKKKSDESADKSISSSEKILTAVDNVQKEIGSRWNKTMGDMEIRTQEVFKKLSDSADTYKKLTDAFNKGFEQLVNTLAKLGMGQLQDFTHAYGDDMTKELTKYVAKTLDTAGKKYNAEDWRWDKLAPNGNFEEYFNAVAKKLEWVINERQIKGGEKFYKKEFLEQDETKKVIKDYNQRIPDIPEAKEDKVIKSIEKRANGDLSSNSKFDETLNRILSDPKPGKDNNNRIPDIPEVKEHKTIASIERKANSDLPSNSKFDEVLNRILSDPKPGKDNNNRIPDIPEVKEHKTIASIERKANSDLPSNSKFDETLNRILSELKAEIAYFNKNKTNVQLNIISNNPSDNWELQETSYESIG